MKMLINKQAPAENEVAYVSWKRDAETFNLLSLQTKNEDAVSLAFPALVLKNTDLWYRRMSPEDAGKELWLLKEVYRKGKGTIRYAIRGLDGSNWFITESMELKMPANGGKGVIHGKRVCEKKQGCV